MNLDFWGWSAILFLCISCSYTLFKRVEIIRNIFKIPMRIILNYHCIFSIVATVLALIHTGSQFNGIRISNGYISLFMMIIITITGVIMKYYSKLLGKYRCIFIYIHIFCSIVLFGSLFLHIVENLLLR